MEPTRKPTVEDIAETLNFISDVCQALAKALETHDDSAWVKVGILRRDCPMPILRGKNCLKS